MKRAAVLAVLLIFCSFSFASLPPDDFMPGRILINFTKELPIPNITYQYGIAKLGIPELDALNQEFGVTSIEKVFVGQYKPSDPLLVDLSRWYYFIFPEEVDVEQAIDAYQGKLFIEEATYHMIRHSDYIPSDPMYNSCWHLATIQADSAWNIDRGTHLIDIAIIDSGIDTAHVDLKNKMWINFGEDVNGDSAIDLWDWNGIDDEGNGWVDDFWGWDFIDQDNTPHDADLSAERGHGTHCSGDASAHTDNAEGVAAIGFNSWIMSVRCGIGGSIQYALSGLNYALLSDADIISMSYGNTQFWTPENNAIQAAWQAGIVLLGSAGNSGSSVSHYPSAYQNVVGVGASNQNDGAASFTNFNGAGQGMYNVDVMAPGVSILSTQLGGGYVSWDGTSMATPIAAGLCAVIKHALGPSATNQQVVTVLANSCDDIYPQNPGYVYPQLGYGRINAFEALLDILPYLQVTSTIIDDNGNNDGRADPGETVNLTLSLTNDPRAQAANNVTGVLSTDDEAVNITSTSQFFGGVIPGFPSSNASPFVFQVGAIDAPHFAEFTLTLSTSSGSIIPITLQIELGRPPILLVDDDNGNIDQIYYQADFDILDVFVDNWNQNSEVISQTELNRYPVVIWETGRATSTLSTSEQTLLQNYLDTPDNSLLLSSSNVGTDIGGSSFYANYLKASFVQDNVGLLFVDGIPSNPISVNDTLFLLGGFSSGYNSSLEAVTPLSGAVETFKYRSTTLDRTAGINFQMANGNKVVYLAFPLEAASGISSTDRYEVLGDILDYLYPDWSVENPPVVSAMPTSIELNPCYPNPFNTETVISYSLPYAADISLKVYNATGQEVAVLAQGMTAPGKHYANFSAEHLAAGIYIAVLKADNISQARKMVYLK